ncbi:hypothetical protein JR316_0002033 [Psilocybe cubensis]|nr:hypothetical protein JR316_0002033 [Psilocybe cubensis]KAH9485126.1 hypothetical protein JR316_0002033 [Psilocybe cubensis]
MHARSAPRFDNLNTMSLPTSAGSHEPIKPNHTLLPTTNSMDRRSQADGRSISLSSLPMELLQEIFLWCVPPRPSQSEFLYQSIYMVGFASQVAPLLLCQVCNLWRHISLTLPRLWTSLDVFVSMGKSRPCLPLANIWLARSGELPLSLALYQQNESNDNRIAAGEILDLYRLYIHRWSNIHFDLTGPRYCRLLTSQQRSAPMLKQFRMQTCYRIYEAEDKDLFGIFDFVPHLSHLQVSRIPDLDIFGETSVRIPWSQLVTLSLDYLPSVGTSLRILENCPKLIDCSFKIDALSGPLPETPINRELHSLEINIGHEQVATFLEKVTLPALKQMTIHVRGPLDQYGWPQSKFGAFLKRSRCRPSHFEIHDTGMRFDEFADCLCNPYLQSLESITVQDRRDWTWDPFVTDLAVNLLTCSPFIHESTSVMPTMSEALQNQVSAQACRLPNLESLTFRGSCLWTADGMVADMVESRWRYHCRQVRRLKRVELELLSSHVEDFRRLKEFCVEGLELDVMLR